MRQRERFRLYLATLEEQERKGTDAGNPEELESQIQIQQSIVREIGTFEQVIEPLALMYREYDPHGADDLPQLQRALERTRKDILQKTEKTCHALKRELASLRSEIASLRVLRRPNQSFLTPEPTTVDISA